MKTKPHQLNLQITGGKKLSGSIKANTSKNAAVGLLCASLLNKGTTTLHDMPKIEEVYRVIEVLESIGVKAHWRKSTLTLTPPKRLALRKIDKNAAIKTRTIIMMIGSLIHRRESFRLPQPGGCKLGSRTVNPHFFGLEELGLKITESKGDYLIDATHLKPADIVLYEAGDTVTENLLMAAALIPGTTTLRFASANYQVQDMCFFLEKLGVQIEGIGTTTLTVHGIEEINQDVEYAIAEDPTESMFWIATAILTQSELTITRSPIDFLSLELLKLEKMGLKYTKSKRYKAKNGYTDLVDLTIFPSKLHALTDKIHPLPYPGLNMDNLPFFAVIATQAEGQTLIHDWVYEKRALYYTELERLGADIILADPHRVFITGKTQLSATEMICPPALRPATILLIGMLRAEGTSILRNIYSINRGYENLVERLNSLGAEITVL